MKKDTAFWSKWLPFFLMAVALIIIYKALDNYENIMLSIRNFFRILSPFLFSILLCYFLYKPCKIVEDVYKESKIKFLAKHARIFGVLLVYICVLILIILFGAFVVPIVVTSLIDLANSLPGYYDAVLNYVENLPENSTWIKSTLEDFTQNGLNYLLDPAILEGITRAIISFGQGIFNFFIALVFSLYILIERDKIMKFFRTLSQSFFKSKTQKQLSRYMAQINKVLFTFIASKGLDSIINWVVITTILLLLNVEYAVLLGLLAGFANFIPYLGSLIAVIVISVLTLITGGVSQAIPTLILLLIFQQLDGNFIEPKIMGTTLKISPLLVILSVIVGGAYFGIIGMFLAVPFITIVKQILNEYLASRRKELATEK